MSCRHVLLALALAGGVCPVAFAQKLPVPDPASNPNPPNLKLTPPPATEGRSAAPPAGVVNQEAMDRLAQSNRELLDLLKKQQSVLEDIQYDRRLQSRRIDLLSERLAEAFQDNAKLQAQVASLQAQLAAAKANPAPSANVAQQPASPAPPPKPETPPKPASYLPPAPDGGMPGQASWHRLFTLSGNESKTTDLFHVKGHSWRIVWHNQDRDGKAFSGTSGLFINAFPKDDTIPQKVCSKVGSGGETVDLQGPGNYYLKIESSGGSWELAVEDLK